MCCFAAKDFMVVQEFLILLIIGKGHQISIWLHAALHLWCLRLALSISGWNWDFGFAAFPGFSLQAADVQKSRLWWWSCTIIKDLCSSAATAGYLLMGRLVVQSLQTTQDPELLSEAAVWTGDGEHSTAWRRHLLKSVWLGLFIHILILYQCATLVCCHVPKYF